jgi:hypothetical protein
VGASSVFCTAVVSDFCLCFAASAEFPLGVAAIAANAMAAANVIFEVMRSRCCCPGAAQTCGAADEQLVNKSGPCRNPETLATRHGCRAVTFAAIFSDDRQTVSAFRTNSLGNFIHEVFMCCTLQRVDPFG